MSTHARPAKELGLSIRHRREICGLRQKDLAKKAELDPTHLCKIERGEHMPTLATLLKIAAVLGVDVSRLLHKGGEAA